jgi:hypothetical protein
MQSTEFPHVGTGPPGAIANALDRLRLGRLPEARGHNDRSHRA